MNGEEQTLQNYLEAESPIERTQTQKQDRAETDMIKAALKTEAEALSSAKNISNQEQIFQDSCQAKLDQLMDSNIKLKTALEKAEQDLKTGYFQWQNEKVSLKERWQKDCDHFHSQVQRIGAFRAREQESVKHNMEIAQAVHQTQMAEQRAETKRIAAALKALQVKTECLNHQQRNISEKEGEILTTSQVKLDEQMDINNKTDAAPDNTEQDLKKAYTLWQEEKLSLIAKYEETSRRNESLMETKLFEAHQEKKECEKQLEYERSQWKAEKAALQKVILEKDASLVVDLECEKKKNKDLLAAVKKAEQQAESHAIEWQQEKSSLTAKLERACKELDDARRSHTTFLQKSEKDARLSFKNISETRNQLLLQRERNIKITKDLKNTEDQLEKERLHFQKLCSQLETSKGQSFAQMEKMEKDHKTLIATLQKESEDGLESERLSWQQEKSSLLQETEQLQQTLKEKEEEQQKTEASFKSELEVLQSRVSKKQRKRWYHLFSCKRAET
ncbi:uncharacterized protein ACO6RY_09907 [Pungitius sinensis]